jgi:purine-binding chemotaxis protein CheW
MAAALTLKSAPTDSTVKTDARAGKYLVFQLDREEFAIPVQSVREILGMLEITHVPQTPNFVKGVINLRGKVIPVVDLRLKFGMEAAASTRSTSIIVVQVQVVQAQGAQENGPRTPLLMGVIVDAVAEVLAVAAADIEDTPSFGQEVAVPYVMGLAKIKGKVKILLDITQVLTTGELARLDFDAFSH